MVVQLVSPQLVYIIFICSLFRLSWKSSETLKFQNIFCQYSYNSPKPKPKSLNLTRKGQLLLLTPNSVRFIFIFSKVAVHKISENFLLGFFNLKLNKQANLL